MSDDTGPWEIMDRADDGIADSGFSVWVRNTAIGGTLLAFVYALQNAILAFGETFMAPFRAIASGLSRMLEGTFFATITIVDAGAEATATSFLDGAAAALGPAAFPVAILSVVAGIWILSRGFRNFSPLDWIRGLGSRFR